MKGERHIVVKPKTWLVLQQLKLQFGLRSMDQLLQKIIREWWQLRQRQGTHSCDGLKSREKRGETEG